MKKKNVLITILLISIPLFIAIILTILDMNREEYIEWLPESIKSIFGVLLSIIGFFVIATFALGSRFFILFNDLNSNEKIDYVEDINTINGYYKYKDTNKILKIEYENEIYLYDNKEDKWKQSNDFIKDNNWIKISPKEAFDLMKESRK